MLETAIAIAAQIALVICLLIVGIGFVAAFISAAAAAYYKQKLYYLKQVLGIDWDPNQKDKGDLQP
jgi:hypothetical protein